MPLVLTDEEVKVLLLGLAYLGASHSEAAEDARKLTAILHNNRDCKNWILHEDEKERAQ